MDQDEFTTFEHEGWEHVVARYQDDFERLTVQADIPLLDALGVSDGTRFLDVATGPGWLAAAAASRGATVTGVDFSAAMIAQARRRYPGIEFQEGSAEALPFADERFDAIGISFGMLHFADPDKALSEAYRVLRFGGKLAFTVWAVPERAVGLGMILEAVGAHGTLDVPIPPGPPFFRFSDADESSRALRDAGFSDPDVREVSQTWHIALPETPFDLLKRCTVRTAAILNAQTPEALARIQAAVAERAAPYRLGDELQIPMPCVLASATKRQDERHA
ncbi:class I SAM-dependent methyltransferase [Burkholderia sp. MR1-5-21]